jgi:nucleolar protein 14
MNQLARIENRRRVGGILDRRFGENDPTMAPEERMLERFTQEKQSRHKGSMFDLEDDNEVELTHMGQSLSLDAAPVDDFDEDLELSDEEDHLEDEGPRKRRRLSNEGSSDDEEGDEEGRPERKKSKQEVMKEVIAKSKLHKYERQAAKDDDDDLREAIDKETSGIHALLQGMGKKPVPAPAPAVAGMNPDRAALLNGTDKIQAEKEYDKRLRQLALDARAKPTERSKTEQEIAEERAKLQKEREEKAQRRMQGLPESDEEEGFDAGRDEEDEEEEENPFGQGIPAQKLASEMGVEDEDDFLIDDDLVASGSDMESFDDDSSEGDEEGEEDEVDAEFLQGILTEAESKQPEFLTGPNSQGSSLIRVSKCPESHEELLEVAQNVNDLPELIKLIRTKYHAKLGPDNKTKLGNFAVALIDHLSYLADEGAPFLVLETIVRHIHSLAKNNYHFEISNGFRRHLKDIHASRPLGLTAGDLVLLTAIGTIFPTSDHFHQVVTPATLTMSRYLGLKISQKLSDYAVGTYLCTLCLQYQQQSKRYIPEVMNFIQNTLCVLAPSELSKKPGNFPYHEPKESVRIEHAVKLVRGFEFSDCWSQESEELKAVLLETSLKLLEAAADLWSGKAAFFEAFEPSLIITQHLGSKHCKPKLSASTQVNNTYPHKDPTANIFRQL